MFPRFLVFFKASKKFALCFPDITLVTIFARDRVDGATGLSVLDLSVKETNSRWFGVAFEQL